MLEAGELDRNPILQMPDDPPRRAPDRHRGSQFGPLIGGNGRARLRDVDDSAGEVDPVRQNEPRSRIAWGNTAMTAVLRQTQDMAIGEPGELGGELVTLACGCRNCHCKAILEMARNDTLKPAH